MPDEELESVLAAVAAKWMASFDACPACGRPTPPESSDG